MCWAEPGEAAGTRKGRRQGLGSSVGTSLVGGGRHLFLVGCGIFGILLKMEKVILVISTHGASSPPPQADPKSVGKGKPPGGVGGAKAGAAMATRRRAGTRSRPCHMTLSTTTTLLLSATGVRVVRPLTSKS